MESFTELLGTLIGTWLAKATVLLVWLWIWNGSLADLFGLPHVTYAQVFFIYFMLYGIGATISEAFYYTKRAAEKHAIRTTV